ncbi:cysteine desulfurase family protein [Lancefieldella parvula]|uniref:cysteine desulfurase n=1 Tax=Lancefieldella parvula (strain ATCC 33793 / DSM 20469 / CCUG 32760 / JCM 10300 / KCTC 3663 / VPI 0546 / 1246) TaxID=521095 RepID=C8WAM3_LANP1|nr:cysteine desulfurase family protein [Lancefieldella parvula]ACV51161.1 aminotransferase class V [Lancefieldella parvula DSM 20469]MDU4867622.1 cysteine desulfurase family protein [Lancefieldella parvula]
MNYVYLDYAASAPMRTEALYAEKTYEASPIAGVNPNSLHSLGRQAARELDSARSVIANAVGGKFRSPDVIFCSGGTEGNNLSVLGMAEGIRNKDHKRNVVVFSAIEHDSVLDLAPVLREKGFEVRIVQPNRQGKIEGSVLEGLLDQSVALVSVMYANNETGVIQPVAELARITHRAGALFHTDAVQAFGRICLEVTDVDALTIAAHKIGGPLGIAAVLMRSKVPFQAQSYGGGQESGRRHGTQDVRGALAFAAATRWCQDNLTQTQEIVSMRANKVYETLCSSPKIKPTTAAYAGTDHMPGTVSIMVPSMDSETLILKLDQAGYEVSAGSACSSGSLNASHVLTAMGISRNEALGSLRITFDERVSESDLNAFCTTLLRIVG